MNKKEAVEVLGVSEKTLGNYVRSGRLTVQYEKGATSKVAVYDEDEVRALAQEISNPSLPANGRGTKLESQVTAKPVKVESPNLVNKEKVESENIVTLAKVENGLPAGAGQGAEVVALIASQIAAGIAEALSQPQLATKPLLTFAEAAQLTGLSERSLRIDSKAGKLKAVRQGRADRISRKNLDAYLDEIHG